MRVKWIEGYEGKYAIDKKGRVWSFRDKHKNFRIKRMKYQLSSKGYLNVGLHKDSKPKRYRIHRLLALAFIPNPDNLTQVNHKDGNKLNITIPNLEWCTGSHNVKHSYNVLNRARSKSKKCKAININTGQILISSSLCDLSKMLGKSRGYAHYAVKNNKLVDNEWDVKYFIEE